MASTEHGGHDRPDHTDRTDVRWGRANGWNESARQVWLAGVGAWTRAQAEGSRVFDGLVRDGLEAERDGTRRRDASASDDATDDAPQFGSGTWDRMGQFVEASVQRAMSRLGVPRRDDLDALAQRIDVLSAELREARGNATAVTKPGTAADRDAATRLPPA